MDAALSFRAMHPQTPAPARADAVAVPRSVPTELPPEQSVAAPVKTSPHNDRGNHPRAAAELPREQRLADEVLRHIEREVEFNEAAKALVSRTVNAKTGTVINQFPNESLLKLRVYVEAEKARTSEDDPLLSRDA